LRKSHYRRKAPMPWDFVDQEKSRGTARSGRGFHWSS